MKSIILITGASSDFGALAARALAMAGHTVYASMRETAGRNAAQVEAARQFASQTEWIFARLSSTSPRRNRPIRPSKQSLKETGVWTS